MEFMDTWLIFHQQSLNFQSVYDYNTQSHSTLPQIPESELKVSSQQHVELDTVELQEREIEDVGIYRHPAWVIIILVIGYLIVLCFGIIGNCSVLIVVARTPRMITVTNIFICNLALSDLLVLIFCILPNLASNIFVPWILGRFLCKTVPYIQGVSVCASIYSLVAISAERCLAIQWPLHSQPTEKTARNCIIAIWMWACLVAAPWAIFFNLVSDPRYPDLEFCVEIWPDGYEFGPNYYFLFGNLILCYLFPLGIISLCYFIIWLRVWRRPLPCDPQSRNSSVELIHQKAKAGVLKMLLVVVLMFALSWLPLYLIFSRIKFGGELSKLEIEIIDIGTPLAQWLGSSNSMWNPCVYAFLNLKFRRAFNNLFFGRQLRREPTPHYQKPNVNMMLKRLKVYKGNTNSSSLFNVTEV